MLIAVANLRFSELLLIGSYNITEAYPFDQ
jgi:hypothetical protein